MLGFFFGSGKNKIKEALRNGAIIVDVRTVFEYDQGRLRGSINIPLNLLPVNIGRIRNMNKPIIICSGYDADSSKAVRFIKQNGISDVYNGGNWEKLLRIINGQ